MAKPRILSSLLVALLLAKAVRAGDETTGKDCTFDGNPDLYGLGVRIAFYVQLVSTFLISKDKAEIPKTLTVNLWFIFALLIALLYTTAAKQLTDVDSYICIYLLDALSILGSIWIKPRWLEPRWITTQSGSDNRNPEWQRSYAFASAEQACNIAILGYGTWFWSVGIFALKPRPCASVGFFFAKVPLHGWLRILHLVWYGFRLLDCAIDLLIVAGFVVFLIIDLLFYREELPSDALQPENGRWEWVAWFLDPNPMKYNGFNQLTEYVKNSIKESSQDGKVTSFISTSYQNEAELTLGRQRS